MTASPPNPHAGALAGAVETVSAEKQAELIGEFDTESNFRKLAGPVGLMVLDLNMPDMHGLEVLQFVRRHPAYRSLPVIVLTTRGDEASRAAALAAGANVYLTKPFLPQVLAEHARSLYEHGGAANAAP